MFNINHCTYASWRKLPRIISHENVYQKSPWSNGLNYHEWHWGEESGQGQPVTLTSLKAWTGFKTSAIAQMTTMDSYCKIIVRAFTAVIFPWCFPLSNSLKWMHLLLFLAASNLQIAKLLMAHFHIHTATCWSFGIYLPLRHLKWLSEGWTCL